LFTCQDHRQKKELIRFFHVDGLFLCVERVYDHSHDPKKNFIKRTEDKIKLKIQEIFDTFQTKTLEEIDFLQELEEIINH
jgi:hypothetical protein